MPLSEHEQRVLEQIERALYAEDPKFAATVRGIDPKARQRRRYVRAGIGVVVGLALLPVGIAIDLVAITFAGFLLALTSFLYGVAIWRRGPERDAKARGRVKVRGRRSADRPVAGAVQKRTVMQRFEDRWNRRREGLGN
ncbi:MAG TPA: DUF3040 domain-containing protein [Acidothermaceae bacterium]|nr:DUF3040 domain-containing protein [Acidothermaceae bacterium]